MNFETRGTPKRLISSLALVVLCGFVLVAQPAEAQFGRPAKQVQLAASILPATNKLPARLAITATIDDGWHVYSVTQPKGGPRPTKIQVTPSSEFEVVGAFVPSTAPVVHVYEDIWPGLNVEEHAGSVTWTAPLKLAPGVDSSRLTIAVTAKGQVCNDQQCNNFKKSLSATQ